MDLRLFSAISAAKATKILIRIFNGGGTAAPGLLAEYIDPLALKKLSKYYQKVILVTGTNGKTTTSRLLGNILSEAKISFIHNRAGSNLLRGIISTLIDNVGVRKPDKNLALLEVDEATLPVVSSQTNPNVIIFNNLFRDQLDRYGEVDKIRKMWLRALPDLNRSTVLVLNSDDHSIAHLGDSSGAKVVYFGIEDKSFSLGKLPHASDFTSCVACGSELIYDEIYLAHLGKYKCSSCNLKRPKPDIFAKKIYLDEDLGFLADIVTPMGEIQMRINMPGLYNVYNSLAAIAAGLVFGISLENIKKALEKATPAFGRTEKLDVDGKKVFIALVKNPAGFNEILRTIFRNRVKKYVLIAINDLIADGRDVSWLWDVDFEVIATKVKKLWVSGVRASDMALRIKYTGAKFEIDLEEDLETALKESLASVPKGETLYVLPTYTAMMKLKKILAAKGVSSPFWED